MQHQAVTNTSGIWLNITVCELRNMIGHNYCRVSDFFPGEFQLQSKLIFCFQLYYLKSLPACPFHFVFYNFQYYQPCLRWTSFLPFPPTLPFPYPSPFFFPPFYFPLLLFLLSFFSSSNSPFFLVLAPSPIYAYS